MAKEKDTDDPTLKTEEERKGKESKMNCRARLIVIRTNPIVVAHQAASSRSER